MRSIAENLSAKCLFSSSLVINIYNCVERLTSVDFNLKRINSTDYINQARFPETTNTTENNQ